MLSDRILNCYKKKNFYNFHPKYIQRLETFHNIF